jgi:hypothetical protein
MAAIVGYVLSHNFVDPPIYELLVTGDGRLLARVGGQFGFDTFVGTYADLVRNWRALIEAAGLTQGEYMEIASRFAGRIGWYGRATA